jgi:tetratricopeptide (TPR) repeat protein
MFRRPGYLTGTPRLQLALAAVVVLILVGAGFFFARPAVELFLAEQALRRYDSQTARSRMDAYLARWPGDGAALLLAAQAARQAGAYADAERLLTACELASGPSGASRLEWTLLGAQQGDFAGGEESLKTEAGRNPAEASAVLEALARGYAVAYRRPEAMAVLQRLLERDPTYAPALVVRGAVLESLLQFDAAEKDSRRAVELAPSSAEARVTLAGVLNRTGHTRESIYHYEFAQRTWPGDPAVLLGLARAYADAAELNEAQRILDELLAGHPEHADALVERGRLALRQAQAAEAEPFLARAVRTAPWHRDGQQLRCLALKELGQSEAVTLCEARLAELKVEDGLGGRLKLRAHDHPDDAAVRWELWEWSLRNGQEREGLAWLFELIRLEPRHPKGQTALADYFERAGQPKRAALHRTLAGS